MIRINTAYLGIVTLVCDNRERIQEYKISHIKFLEWLFSPILTLRERSPIYDYSNRLNMNVAIGINYVKLVLKKINCSFP